MPCPRSLSPQGAQLAQGTLPGAGGVQLQPLEGCPLLSNRTTPPWAVCPDCEGHGSLFSLHIKGCTGPRN